MSSANSAADESFMDLAIEASAQAVAAGNLPFGAVLVKDGVVLGVAQNNQVTARDATGHAETLLVREVSAARGPGAVEGATVYASGEPCAMCAGAMFWARVARVVFAATQPDIIEAIPGMALPIRSAVVLAGSVPEVRVEGEVGRARAVEVLKRFAASRAGGV